MLRADKAQIPTLRADRVRLPRKVVQGDGAVRYHAVLARADAPMQYEWGTEIATEAALTDPEYLEGLRGISLVTIKSATHQNGRPVSVRADARAVGSVLDARWDPEERAVVVELVVHDAETLDDIDAGRIRELSEAYIPTTAVRADGVIEQRKRRTNHIALVEEGRMPGAVIRADQTEDTDMTEEQITALVQKVVAQMMDADKKDQEQADMMDEEKKRADEAEQRADAAEKALSELRATVGLTADSADVDTALAGKVAEMVRADSALLEEARELGVDLDDDSTPATRLRDIAVALGADAQRADSADFARAFIDGRKAAPRPSAAQRHKAAASASTTTGAVVRRVS